MVRQAGQKREPAAEAPLTGSKSVLKGPGVRVKALLVGSAEERAAARDGRPAGAPAQEGPDFRAWGSAPAQAERLLAQAQVELGRAKAEAEQIRQEAQARLAEAGEVIATLAEARRVLEESRAEAAALVARAQAEAGAVTAAAREAGLEEGRRMGLEEGARLARDAVRYELELAQQLAERLQQERDQVIARAEPAIIRLAVAVAGKVIAREIDADPDVLSGLVTRAMLKAAGDDRLRLRLHPEALERLGGYLDNLVGRFAARGVEVVPDPTLGPDGIVVESRSGTVDAGVGTQLARIEGALLSVIGA